MAMANAEAVAVQMVSVIAPSDMEAGYQFQAEMDGQQFTVTVPDGGVKEGQSLEVPFTPGVTEPMVNQSGSSADPPIGNWRNEMCDCCETCACPFFMAWCLNGILLGQIMQRMKLNFLGLDGGYENTCLIATILTFVGLALSMIAGGVNYQGSFVYTLIFIWFVVAATLTRNMMRKKYKIPGSCCGDSALDDCCCAFWCSCCVTLQMHRHTHDEKGYNYDITSKTGLDPAAPEVV